MAPQVFTRTGRPFVSIEPERETAGRSIDRIAGAGQTGRPIVPDDRAGPLGRLLRGAFVLSGNDGHLALPGRLTR